jgi:microcystin-dependent protein
MAMLITNLTPQDYWFGPLHLPAGNGSMLTVDDTSATSLYLNDDTVADAINTLYAHTPPLITVTGAATPFPRATGTPSILHGDGSPEGVVYAGQGSIYMRRDNTGGTQLYQKTTGIHVNTGWTGFAGAVVTTPTGAVTAFGGTSAPTGWLICDGSAVSRTTYSDLFAAIGTNFGSGDGSTTFNIPDMRGRVPTGYAASGGHIDVSAIGNNDGVAVANRRPKHQTSKTDSGHTHRLLMNVGGAGSATPEIAYQVDGSGSHPEYSSGVDGKLGGGTTIANLAETTATGITVGTGNVNDSIDAPAYLVLNHIIKT